MLAGKKIIDVRAMSKAELAAEGWSSRSPVTVLVLDDGSKVFASRDEEGNGPGTLLVIDNKDKLYQIIVS